jgi:DNA-binding transcriptional ArsR family regulator
LLVSVTTTTERATIRDPAVLRALAHPVRLGLLQHMSVNPEGATATECASVVGLSPSATSYHLRALAKAGMIREAPSRGDGRERVWQAVYQGYELSTDLDASTEEVAAQYALIETFLARQNDVVLRFLAVARLGAPEWFEPSLVSDRTILVTARELKRLTTQIDELTRPLIKSNRRQPPKGARLVSFQLRAVPTDAAD